MLSEVWGIVKLAWGRRLYLQVLPLFIFLYAAAPATAVAAVNPQVAAGSYHTVALKSDGTVWAWGDNEYGQLGDGTTIGRTVPQQVPGLTNVIAVAAGDNHSVALKADGTVWTWGYNGFGQLGLGLHAENYSLVPANIAYFSGVVTIAAGGDGSAAIKNDGTLYMWGRNDFGQLGIGRNWGSLINPSPVTSLTGIVGIALGRYHSIALKSDGSVWSWGDNTYGQLGDSSTAPSANPREIVGLDRVTAVAAGMQHSVALKRDGSLWTWGDNQYNQLGDGTPNPASTPKEVAGVTGITAIAATGYHTIAIQSGVIWSWGDNDNGQLGDRSIPHAVPVRLDGLSGIVSVGTGAYHTVALKNDGVMYAWGDNEFGQLGTGSTTSHTTPFLVAPISGATSVTAGDYHTLAIKNDGTVWGWGDNTSGQLGNGKTIESAIPQQAVGLTSIVAVAAGESHSVALKNDGTVWTWGGNASGQLGDGSTVSRSVPQQVTALTGIIAVAAGTDHTVVLQNDGTIWAWGGNTYGQLGTGDTVSHLTPVHLSYPVGITAITAGAFHTMALKSGVSYWLSWGYNSNGQLGDGGTTTRLSPVGAGFGEGAVFSGGGYHSALVKNDGSVWTWGYNGYGELGNNTVTDSWIPLQTDLYNAAKVAAGSWHTAALKNDGTVWTWGLNDDGQLGNGATVTAYAPVEVAISGVSAVDAGEAHTVALKNDGTVWTWGSNAYSQLGDNRDLNPTAIPGVTLGTFPPVTVANPPGGTFYTAPVVTLKSNKPAIIYYTSNGMDPTTASSVYTGPLAIGTTTLKFFAVDASGIAEPVKTENYIFDPGQRLTVTVSGTSSAGVSYSTGKTCTSNCNDYIPAGTVITLTPLEGGTTFFDSWSGCDQVLENDRCVVTMDAAKNVIALFAAAPSIGSGTWSATGSMWYSRYQHSATLLNNGKVLAAGGTTYPGSEQYVGPGWTLSGNYMAYARSGLSTTLLADGKVVAIGGYDYGKAMNVAAVEVYNPATIKWGAAGSLQKGRSNHKAVLLHNGKLLVIGGYAGGAEGSVELYDPTTGTSTFTAPTAYKRYLSTATLLPNGKVLVVGGSGGDAAATAELYDPDSGTWSMAAPMAYSRTYHTATLLPNGKVLVAGGGGPAGTANSAELYDPVTDSWTPAGSMSTAHSHHSATLLPNGRVLVAGDWNTTNQTSAEQYDPLTDSWSFAERMVYSGYEATATLLQNGKVLVAGGWGTSSLSTAQLYQPSPVATSALPAVKAAPGGGTYGGPVAVTLSANVPGTIYYTTNGQDPVTSQERMVFSSSIYVLNSTVLKYYAVDTAGHVGEVRTAVYTINDTTAPVTTPSIPGGTFAVPQTVTLRANEPSTIYYTLNGTDPYTSPQQQVYSGPLAILKSTTLKYGAKDVAGNAEAVKTVNLVINPPVTTLSPPGGTYAAVQTVTLTANQPATIYYTTNGQDPTSTGASLYSGPFTVAVPTTLKYYAKVTGGGSEAVKTAVYTINPPVTAVTPPGGTYSTPQYVTLTANQPSTIYYTTNGLDPTTSSSVFTASLYVSAPTTLKYFAKVAGGLSEAVKTTVYVIKQNQTISFSSLPPKRYLDPSFTVSATATSGLTVTYTSSNPAVATVNGNTVTIVGVGNTTITASQGGNELYNAAPAVTQTLTVNKAIATLTLGSLTTTYDGSAKSATATTTPPNLTVVFTYSGSSTPPTNAGSYSVAATIDDLLYEGSTSGTLIINKANQTISFAALSPVTYGAAPLALTATASSGLGVTYTSSNTAVATVSGNVVTIKGAGSATITAGQAGNADYQAAPNVSQLLMVSKATATVTLAFLSHFYDGSPKAVTAFTDPPGLPVVITYDGSPAAPSAVGTYSVFATVNHANYEGSTSDTLTIIQAFQTITFDPLPQKSVGDLPFALTATASSGLTVTYTSSNPAVATVTGNTVTIVGAGTTTISASQSGNSNYKYATPVLQILTVAAGYDPQGVKLTDNASVSYFGSISAAYAAIANGSNTVLQLMGGLLTDTLLFDKAYALTLKGGYDSTHSAITGVTTIRGTMTVKNGTVTVSGTVAIR